MPATSLNLACLLEHQARMTPEREAVVCGDVRLTYGRLHAMACQAASGLRQVGLAPGDHVALNCPNLPQFVVAYYAILKIGAVVVPLNVLSKPREIAALLEDSDATALVVFEGTPELPMAAMAREACRTAERCRHLIVITLDPSAPSPVDSAVTLGQVMHGQPSGFESHAPSPDDTAVMLCTSGTTGQPKAAELTHANMLLNALASRDMLLPLLDQRLDSRIVSLITLPLFHSTAQTAQMNAGVAGGFTLVLLPRFDPAAVLAMMSREHASLWIGVPTMYWMLMQYAREHDVDVAAATAGLRLCVSGGAPMPVALLEAFQKTFGVRVLEGYGLSETSPVACFNQVFLPSKAGTVGVPILGCEVRVVDADGRPVATGERGEVVIRGPNVMKGYYKRPAETAEALRGGWLLTGDIGTLDADGYLSIVDRKKDLILRGGMNVYPREIEEVLLTHPDIALAAVIGVPDERLGEEVKALVVLKTGAQLSSDDVITWSRDQMAAYKYPRIVELRESLPIGPTGKVFKRGLK